jgi:hypothetical protein
MKRYTCEQLRSTYYYVDCRYGVLVFLKKTEVLEKTEIIVLKF